MPKLLNPESNQKKIPDKPKLGDILQNNWPALFKSVRHGRPRKTGNIRDHRRPRRWCDLTQCVTVNWALNQKSDVSRAIGKILFRSVDYVIVLYQCLFPNFDHSIIYCGYIKTLVKSRERVYRNFCAAFTTFL